MTFERPPAEFPWSWRRGTLERVTKISPEMIEIVNMPQAEAEPVAIIPIDLACQAVTRVAIAEGEQVTYAKLQRCGYDGH